MLLKELLKDIVDIKLVSDVEITGLSCDSRTVQNGFLFFALPGTVTDGSKFMAEAVQKGASAIIHESETKNDLQVPQLQVENARLVMAKLASRFFKHPTEKFYLSGVTGTNGKTTTTYLLEKIWFREIIGVIGTVNTRYKKTIIPSTHTTPDSIEIQKIFDEMSREEIRTVVIEVSSHALEQRRVASSHFDSAVFTNLTQDHLDYHLTMEAYYQAKKLFFTEVLSQSSKRDKMAIINADDPYGQRLMKEIEGLYPIRTFSLRDPKADITALNAKHSIQGTEAEIKFQDKTVLLNTNLLGAHNLKNILAALLVALHRDPDLEFHCEQLREVVIPGRLERVLDSNFFVDYAHTPDALENVLSAVRGVMQKGRLIVVFGCGGDRDKGKRPLMGRAVADFADVLIVTSDNPRTEDPKQIIQEILPGIRPIKKDYDGGLGVMVEVDRRLALEKAVALAKPDDVVVVAGKGHEDYQIIGTKKVHFDDKEILRESLSTPWK